MPSSPHDALPWVIAYPGGRRHVGVDLMPVGAARHFCTNRLGRPLWPGLWHCLCACRWCAIRGPSDKRMLLTPDILAPIHASALFLISPRTPSFRCVNASARWRGCLLVPIALAPVAPLCRVALFPKDMPHAANSLPR